MPRSIPSAKSRAAISSKLRGCRNHLGDLNDIAHVRGVVGALLRDKSKKDDDGAMRYAAGAVVGWYGAQVPHAAKQALKR